MKTRIRKKKLVTFTKKWVEIILTTSLIDIQLVFVLAFFNKIQIAETLGVALVTQVVGVFTAYAVKAFFETYAEAKDTIEYTKIGIDKDNASNSISVG
ncbi:hypothetical protein [Clostridium sp.]|jgi:hypothetical protein|uniref:hypothetical protein n=1 Tax=Clostridium sp. TaxID=1506 RepID=UPI0025C568DD|nr:hypothetical protein [Clostridium sp.]